MASVFTLPDLGEGLHEAEIVAWHVGVGDHIVVDQPLVSVETDKAIVEVPSPRSGHIAALHGEPGDIVQVGDALVEYSGGEVEDRGTVVGDVPKAEAAPAARPPEAQARIKAAPAVRRLAGELDVDLATLEPSGVDGTITRADVEAAARGARARSDDEGVKLRGVRRAMAKRMTLAGREVVPATLSDEADIEDWSGGADLTVRLIRAVAAGARASPSLNAWFDAEAETLSVHDHVDLGIAVETAEGLFAPVIRDVGNRDDADLRRGLEALKRDIEQRTVEPAALCGPTITLSNFGMFGGRFAELVVVPPQVAILGAGRARARVVAHAGQAAVRRQLPLSLSFDHRVVTGVEAARFLSAVIEDLEEVRG